MTKVHTPDPQDEHCGAAGALAGSLLNAGTTLGLEAASTRTLAGHVAGPFTAPVAVGVLVAGRVGAHLEWGRVA